MSEQEMKRAEATNEDFARDVLAYSAGYEAGKSDAQPALLLSEEEREAINEGAMALNREAERYEQQADHLGDTFATSDGYKTYRELERRKRRQSDVLLRLARSAPADSVVVRREVALRKLLGVAQGIMQIEPLWLPAEPLTGEHEAEGIALDMMKSLLVEAIAEAEAALKGAEP